MADELKPISRDSIDQWWANIKANSNTLNGKAPTTEISSGVSLTTPTPPTEEKVDYNKQIVDEINEGNKLKMKRLKAFQEAEKEHLSAYQTLVKDAFKRKEEIAKKQERNARSQALANALGSLVNVITAGAMASKGGYAPIVANYDNTADNALRKSIEQRYALANENENLLMNLENERRKQEREWARQNYAQEIASIDAETKAKTDHWNTLAKEELYRDRTKWRIGEEVEAAKQKATDKGEVQKGVKTHAAAVDAKKPKQEKAKAFKYNNDNINQFVANVTSWEEKTPNRFAKDGSGFDIEPHKASDSEKAFATRVAKFMQNPPAKEDGTARRPLTGKNAQNMQSIVKILLMDKDYNQRIIGDITGELIADIADTIVANTNASDEKLVAEVKKIVDGIK